MHQPGDCCIVSLVEPSALLAPVADLVTVDEAIAVEVALARLDSPSALVVEFSLPVIVPSRLKSVVTVEDLPSTDFVVTSVWSISPSIVRVTDWSSDPFVSACLDSCAIGQDAAAVEMLL